jgi:hypothetical protein
MQAGGKLSHRKDYIPSAHCSTGADKIAKKSPDKNLVQKRNLVQKVKPVYLTTPDVKKKLSAKTGRHRCLYNPFGGRNLYNPFGYIFPKPL